MLAVVGLAVSAKKRKELTARGFFEPRQGLEYRAITNSEDIPGVDIVLSKMYPGMDESLVETLSNLPTAKHVISPETQKVFSDRWSVIERIWTSDTVMVPDSALVTTSDDGLIEAYLMEHERVILKPRIASGPRESHQMCIASSLKEVKLFMQELGEGLPIIVQQLVEHDGSFFKVFVVGSTVEFFARKSISPELMDGKSFNTQGLFKDAGESNIPQLQTKLEILAREIARLFECDLLGIDVVVETGTGKLLVVDVNYFPTYREMGDRFPSALDDLITSR